MDQRLAKWFSGRDTGSSSKAIACHMAGGTCDGSSPSDPADLGRCLRLLEIFPEWKPRIKEMMGYGGEWLGLAPHWDELEKSMADEVGIDWSKGQKAGLTYKLMRKYIDEGLCADPNIKVMKRPDGSVIGWVRKGGGVHFRAGAFS